MGFGPGMLCFHWSQPGKAEWEKEKLGTVMLFPKGFRADLFSSYCKMETFGCRA